MMQFLKCLFGYHKHTIWTGYFDHISVLCKDCNRNWSLDYSGKKL